MGYDEGKVLDDPGGNNLSTGLKMLFQISGISLWRESFHKDSRLH
jgi:hypothetical protein